eukprot:gene8193-11083_t
MRRAVVADASVLNKYGCVIDVEPQEVVKGSIFENIALPKSPILLRHPSGWEFQTFHSDILDESQLQSLTHSIKCQLSNKYSSLNANPEDGFKNDKLDINDYKLRLPAMIFGNDIVKIKRQDNSNQISINSMDAILCFAEQHTAENVEKRPLRIVKVPYASQWVKKVEVDGFKPNTYAAGSDANSPHLTRTKYWDWTFSNDYCFTIVDGDKLEQDVVAVYDMNRDIKETNISNGNVHNKWKIEEIPSTGVDYNMLRQQDKPILFFDECILYQDDLEDCGEVVFEVKMRVMPDCWFVLNKLFVRVDGSFVRCRETRLFHKFSFDSVGNNVVYMEVCWREMDILSSSFDNDGDKILHTPTDGKFQEMIINHNQAKQNDLTSTNLNLPYNSTSKNPSSSIGADYQFTQSLKPKANPLEAKNMTQLLPIINQSEGISEFYKITI